MANKHKGTDHKESITFVPPGLCSPGNDVGAKSRKFSSVFESMHWQSLGWVHSPLFTTATLDFDSPTFSELLVERQIPSNERATDPKLQIENDVPYGVLPKEVVVDIEIRKFAKQDIKSILHEIGIELDVLLPHIMIYNDRMEMGNKEYLEGIPTKPFLDLNLFDDAWYYDLRSPKEWLAQDHSDNGAKFITALAFIPEKDTGHFESHNFDWRPVSVLDYDAEKNLYLVSRSLQSHENVKTDNWIPRIYLKFDAEEPLHFIKRLLMALRTRHMIEESLRMTYYVECMPLENSPDCPQRHLDAIYSIVRGSRQLQSKLKWIRNEWEKVTKEIKLEYKKSYNILCYEEIAKQVPSLTKDFINNSFSFHKKDCKRFKAKLNFSFKERLESFQFNTLYTTSEVVKALTMIQSNILALHAMSLYILPLEDIYSLEKFETLQRNQLQTVTKYIQDKWIADISNAILLNLEKCGKGQYDLSQKKQHTFKLTKLGKLLKMVMFKMQDEIRFLVIESLKNFSTMIHKACESVINVEESLEWNDNLLNNKFSPSDKPIFEVPLEIKGDRLKFGIDIKKYAGTVRDLFLEGLNVTKDLPRLEKFVMKRMLYNPEDKLETVTEKEKQVMSWRMNIIRGMDRAILAADAYIKAYDPLLKPFKTDQINYVKQFARKKVNCDQLKQIIEMHNEEKIKLENSIPPFLDIGPFRLITKTVRTAAIKKHEQLADAVLSHFYGKLNQFMESIKDEFLVLHDRIRQPTGNIEDLLDKKQWCRTVPKKIEKLSADVNRLRSDVCLLSTFHRNMEDEDFNTFWQVQEFPQLSMKMLQKRISTFEEERDEHKDHLATDVLQLQLNLEKVKEEVASLDAHSDLQNCQAIATEIRKVRKNIKKFDEQAHLYKKRGKLLGQPQAEYPEINEMSNALLPYENFWLSTAEFYKYNERDLTDLISMDSKQLKEAIEEFHMNLQEALKYFKVNSYREIHNSIAVVLEDVKEFINSKLSKVL